MIRDFDTQKAFPKQAQGVPNTQKLTSHLSVQERKKGNEVKFMNCDENHIANYRVCSVHSGNENSKTNLKNPPNITHGVTYAQILQLNQDKVTISIQQ